MAGDWVSLWDLGSGPVRAAWLPNMHFYQADAYPLCTPHNDTASPTGMHARTSTRTHMHTRTHGTPSGMVTFYDISQ